MKLSFRSTIASILVRAFAHAAIATPASAPAYEYCFRDAESYAQSCDFDLGPVLGPGLGGDGYRDPFHDDVSGAHAYAPICTPGRAVPSKIN